MNILFAMVFVAAVIGVMKFVHKIEDTFYEAGRAGFYILIAIITASQFFMSSTELEETLAIMVIAVSVLEFLANLASAVENWKKGLEEKRDNQKDAE